MAETDEPLPTFTWALNLVRERYNCPKPALLLGNGFSQAFSSDFGYKTLRAKATLDNLSNGVTKDDIFEHVGTNDFETVIHTLERAAQLQEIYTPFGTLQHDLKADAEVVKKGLVDALGAIHPSSAQEVDHRKYLAARMFLSNFSLLFTLNYDLLLYWTRNHQVSLSQSTAYPIPSNDGFTDYGDSDRPLTWKSPGYLDQEVFHLHGAMHLYAEGNETRKLRYKSGGGGKLIDQVRQNLNAGNYPLVVTEGSRENKQERIAANPYLSYCYNRLRQLDGVLFVHGVALSENDQHILDAISDPYSGVTTLFVGLFGDKALYRDVKHRAEGIALERKQRGGRELRVEFYQSASAEPWG